MILKCLLAAICGVRLGIALSDLEMGFNGIIPVLVWLSLNLVVAFLPLSYLGY